MVAAFVLSQRFKQDRALAARVSVA
jgi:hypothetical protein